MNIFYKMAKRIIPYQQQIRQKINLCLTNISQLNFHILHTFVFRFDVTQKYKKIANVTGIFVHILNYKI